MQGDYTWLDWAACIGLPTDLFFQKGRTGEAIRVCAQCPVQQECLDDALRIEMRRENSFGVFGGMRAGRRQQIVKRRKKAKRLNQSGGSSTSSGSTPTSTGTTEPPSP